MKVRTSKKFDKAYTRLQSHQRLAIDEALAHFIHDRTDPALRDHALKGRLAGLRSFEASWDLRVIYREEGGYVTIFLLDAGSHNQVY